MQRMSDADSPPVAWDPCRPIHVVVNTAEAPPNADRLLTEAANEVSRATGLKFVIEGTTDEVPDADRAPLDPQRYGNRWSPALVAWTNPRVVPELDGRVAGVGGPRAATYAQSVDQHWVSGIVFLDAPTFRSILNRTEGWADARAIVMHELAHMVGLTHVKKRSELMYDDNVGKHEFGAGDLEGLRRLGMGRCFTR
ncbi:matrixin family metalloprotease [Pedococcus sp. KACC 23699]|uniref:Matrixin family metalloprotease n=1 Tax=Pedococcus sp. KACC 23699 TaxID=3149228 RepID=A0AAU7JR13_9MICO